MKINELLNKIEIKYNSQEVVTGLNQSDKDIMPGEIYFAIKGANFDGNDFIESAFAKGAILVFSEQQEGAKIIKVDNIKLTLKKLIEHYYGDFYHQMQFIGVTGTNGKSTTTYLIHQSLIKLNCPNLLIGTNGVYDGENHFEINNTTPDFLDLIRHFKRAYDKGIRRVVMEVSSIALRVNRLHDLKYDIVIFTNLSPEHLDFHSSMEEYLASKMELFLRLKANGRSIINGDDHYAPYFSFSNNPLIIKKDYNFTIINEKPIELSVDGISISSRLSGDFNCYNLMCCYYALKSLEYSSNQIKDVIEDIIPLEGRLQTIKLNTNEVIIDFGHTPEAMNKVLSYLSRQKYHKIIVLFGCGGNRDTAKRPQMLEVASQYGNEIIICDDNPRCESSLKIIGDILKGMKSDHLHIISARDEAIKFGLSLLDKNDCLIIFGKGHEKYQIIGTDKIPFSDYEEVAKWQKNG